MTISADTSCHEWHHTRAGTRGNPNAVGDEIACQRMATDLVFDSNATARQNSPERRFALLDLALRITFFIVGPVPVLLLFLHIAVALELTIELIAWDSTYYQRHQWCPIVACFVTGAACFAARRVRYFGAGWWFGPLLVAIGTYQMLQ